MTFPVMPMNSGFFVPKFSATLRFSGSVTTSATLDASSYITSSYSTLFVVQLYDTPGGGENFYYPPTTKLNGVDMPLVASVYTNAFDDGNAWSISTASVRRGDPATITWTAASNPLAAVYEVLGFRDMAASVLNVASSVNLASNNAGCPRNTVVNTSALSKVFMVTLGAVTAGVDISGQMNQFNNVGSWQIGWDNSAPTPTNSYFGGNRGTTVVSFNTAY